MYWWVLGIVVAFFVVRSMWRAYTHPSHVLARQAANMSWVATGRVPDEDGYKNVKLKRDGMEAVISFQNGNVELVKPRRNLPFSDFIELEKWLATKMEESADDEIKYYDAVNNYINSQGYCEPLLEIQGTDEEYCIASMKMQKAGYISGQSEKVVGALMMDSVNKYRQNRRLSIIFLQKLAEQFSGKREKANISPNTMPAVNADHNYDDFHPVLDKAVGEASAFLEKNNLYVPRKGNGEALNIRTELLIYIVSFLAKHRSGESIANISWNSFKSSIENRILAELENPPSLSGSVVDDKSTTFVHYASEYLEEMSKMEGLILSNIIAPGDIDLRPLVEYFLASIGSNDSVNQSLLLDYISGLERYAHEEIVPRVKSAFK